MSQHPSEARTRPRGGARLPVPPVDTLSGQADAAFKDYLQQLRDILDDVDVTDSDHLPVAVMIALRTGISQRDLGERLMVSHVSIGRWVSGLRLPPVITRRAVLDELKRLVDERLAEIPGAERDIVRQRRSPSDTRSPRERVEAAAADFRAHQSALLRKVDGSNPEHLPAVIRMALRTGTTQSELSELVEVSHTSVMRWLNGDRLPPDITRIAIVRRVREFLSASPDGAASASPLRPDPAGSRRRGTVAAPRR